MRFPKTLRNFKIQRFSPWTLKVIITFWKKKRWGISALLSSTIPSYIWIIFSNKNNHRIFRINKLIYPIGKQSCSQPPLSFEQAVVSEIIYDNFFLILTKKKRKSNCEKLRKIFNEHVEIAFWEKRGLRRIGAFLSPMISPYVWIKLSLTGCQMSF